jgi:MFS family permease
MENAATPKKTWNDVLDNERRQLGLDRNPEKAQGIGLALSGGGIRSGVFCLGVIQYLAQQGLLRKIDYLSTVSGGGYIGAWLSTYLQRLYHHPEKVSEGLPRIGAAQEQEIKRTDLESLRYMRRFSNYLTPKTGLSRDLLSTIGIVISNLLLSALVVLSLLLATAFAVLFFGTVLEFVVDAAVRPELFAGLAFWVATLLAYLAMKSFCTPVANILDMYRSETRPREAASNDPCVEIANANTKAIRKAMWLTLLSLLLLGVAVANMLFTGRAFQAGALPLSMFSLGTLGPAAIPVGAGVVGVVALGVFYWIANWPLISLSCAEMKRSGHGGPPLSSGARRKTVLQEHLGALASGVVGGAVLCAFALVLDRYFYYPEWTAVLLCVPVVVIGILATLTVHMMLYGRNLPPELREWWYRVFSTLLIVGLGWLALFAAALIGPALLRPDSIAWMSSAVAAWMGSAAYTAFMALGKFSGKPGENRLLAKLTPLAVWVFVAGIVLAAFALAYRILDLGAVESCKRGVLACMFDYAQALSALDDSVVRIGPVVLALIVTGLVLWTLNHYYNTNVHSMNQLYRNRLVRCFLGATNPEHDERAPSGFDHKDDYPMQGLNRQRPLHIVCASLNLSGSKELAWQTRKALSFMFTPFYVGYVIPRLREEKAQDKGAAPTDHYFVSTESYMKTAESPRGVSLGSAISISGAAASPNQGYHTNKGMAFLMALANVRTGRWCPNPRLGDKIVSLMDPKGGIFSFVKELFGNANECQDFVYLSDGGHFDNLGLYELIRRRCKAIIVIDGEQDGEFKFDGLSEGIRKARLDLNAEVELAATEIRPPEKSRYSMVCAKLGKVIYLENPAEPAPLLYVKLSLPEPLAGKLPIDVVAYAAAHEDFPHQSTGDQWFDEAQFEAYRKLGYAIAELAFVDGERRRELGLA